MMSSIMLLGKSLLPKTQITEDDLDRLCVSVKMLADRSVFGELFIFIELLLSSCPLSVSIYNEACRGALTSMLAVKGGAENDMLGKDTKVPVVTVQADDSIAFPQLQARADGPTGDAKENAFDMSLSQAMGTHGKVGGLLLID